MVPRSAKELSSDTNLSIVTQTATSLQINVPESLLDGTYAHVRFQITNPAPGGGTVTTGNVSIVAARLVTGVSPNPVPLNTAFTLTLTGTNLDLPGTATLYYDGMNSGQLTPTSRTATTATFVVPADRFTNAGFHNCFLFILGSGTSNYFELQAE